MKMRKALRAEWPVCACAGLMVGLLGPLSRAAAQQSFDEWMKEDQAAFQEYSREVTRQYEQFVEEDRKAFAEFVKEAGARWGRANVWLPEKKAWVQYTPDLEERSQVQFEDGQVKIQILVEPGADPRSPAVQAMLRQGVERVVLSGTVDPIDLFRYGRARPASRPAAGRPAPAPAPRAPAATPAAGAYRVQKGDTLTGVARRLGVSREDLARANGLDPNGWLKIGQDLRVPRPGGGAAAPAAAPAPDADRPEPGDGARVIAVDRPVEVSADPVLRNQVAMPDGTIVTEKNAADYARDLVARLPPAASAVKGDDGQPRQAVSVQFPLVKDHVKVRAERYKPLVLECAQKHKVYPPLVFAIMQTESAFNPRARSGAPAFGLMQLVPQSGARDAYRLVHGEDKMVTGDFLYDPRNNVELGVALLSIMDTRYLAPVNDPVSRLYCVVAAYNTGAGNVARAFSDGRNVKRAAPTINQMDKDEVFQRLCANLPYEETRNYVRKVRERMPLYRDWQ